jgi:hypothetical protein
LCSLPNTGRNGGLSLGWLGNGLMVGRLAVCTLPITPIVFAKFESDLYFSKIKLKIK